MKKNLLLLSLVMCGAVYGASKDQNYSVEIITPAEQLAQAIASGSLDSDVKNVFDLITKQLSKHSYFTRTAYLQSQIEYHNKIFKRSKSLVIQEFEKCVITSLNNIKFTPTEKIVGIPYAYPKATIATVALTGAAAWYYLHK